MKIFLDTNVVLDYLFGRDKSKATDSLFDKIDDCAVDAYISSGSVYTITYLTEMSLKKNGVGKNVRLAMVREHLALLLFKIKVATVTNSIFHSAFVNLEFDDLEDAYQYHTAIAAGCDYFVTQNHKDFPADNGPVVVCSPAEIVRKI